LRWTIAVDHNRCRRLRRHDPHLRPRPNDPPLAGWADARINDWGGTLLGSVESPLETVI